MMRRLGQSAYRSESPHLSQDTISLESTCTLPSIDYSRDDALSLATLSMETDTATPTRNSKDVAECRYVDKMEIMTIMANICRKLDTIVSLVSDFTSDVMSLREQASDLLKELKDKVLPYLINLDLDMSLAENLLRYNIDQSNIQEDRIDWLLQYNKYHMEMRRVFRELSGAVYEDLEDALQLRCRGIIARRASPETVENLTEMKNGMQRAVSLLCC